MTSSSAWVAPSHTSTCQPVAAATAASRSGSRPASVSRAPVPAGARAVAAPMPEEAP
ncbi:hypothetical protein ABZ912_60015 [Nonomuraea angiospora]|uniref:hypothetical protein n=1 Tax=Nonomuraea angiospora TaxID=46172 RepID=UPI0033E5E1C2